MGVTNKKIVITGEASGVAQAMQQVEQTTRRATNSIISDTVRATEAQDDYAKKIIATPTNEQVKTRVTTVSAIAPKPEEPFGRDAFRAAVPERGSAEEQQSEASFNERLLDAVNHLADVIQRAARTEQREDERRHDEEIESAKPAVKPPEKDIKKDIEKEPERKSLREKFSDAGRRVANVARGGANAAAGFLTAPNEYSAASSALGIIPIVGEALSQIAGRAVEEATQLLSAQAGLRATGAQLGYGADFTRFGLNRAAANQEAQGLLQARGAGAGTITRDLSQTLALRKGTGLSQGAVFGAARAQRVTDGGSLGQQIGSLAELLEEQGVLRAGGDTTRLTELLEIQNTLIEDQSQTIENVNQQGIARTISAFQGLGGSFADRRASGTIQTINRAVTDPQGDFRESFVLRELRDLMPDASLFELREAQEKGIFENPELFERLFKSIQARGGTEDSVLLQLKEFFNLSFSQTRKLYEGVNSDPEFFKKFSRRSTDTDFAKTGERGAARFGAFAGRGVSGIDRSTAVQTDRLAKIGVEFITGMDKLFNKALSIISDPGKFITDTLGKLKSGFNDLIQPIIKQITKGFNRLKEDAGKLIEKGGEIIKSPISSFKRLQNNVIPGLGDFFDPLGLYGN